MAITIKNPTLLARSDHFFKSLKSSDRIALLHDTDPDGTTSGKIIVEALKQIGCLTKLFLITERKEHFISDEKITLMKQHNINILITTDKTVDSGPEQIKKIEQFAHIVVFDHHIIEHDIASEKTLFLKPQLLFDGVPPDRYCSAKLSYDILSRVTNLAHLDWICAIGVIGDMAYPAWPEFMDSVYKKYNIKPQPNPIDTSLGMVTQLISFAESLGEAETCFNQMLQSNSIEQATKNLQQYSIVKQELEHYINNAEKVVEKYNNNQLIIYEINSKYKIKSMLSTALSQRLYPNKTLIIVQQIDNEMTISARRQDCTKNMNTLLKLALGSLNGNAGGHAPASGGSVFVEDYPEFKKRLIESERKKEIEISA